MSARPVAGIVLGLALVIAASRIYVMGSPDNHISLSSPATVTLDVYSGRTNPSWRLSPEAAVELVRRLRTLEPTATQPASDDDLGYRSVSVAFSDPSHNAVLVTASRGFVMMEERSATGDHAAVRKFFIDQGRGFEAWLVNTGKGTPEVPADLLKSVNDELSKRKEP